MPSNTVLKKNIYYIWHSLKLAPIYLILCKQLNLQVAFNACRIQISLDNYKAHAKKMQKSLCHSLQVNIFYSLPISRKLMGRHFPNNLWGLFEELWEKKHKVS